VKRAKLPPNLWVYDLRHRRITNWLGEGQSPVRVPDAAGHADSRTTMRYTHLMREHLRPLAGAPHVTPREAAIETRAEGAQICAQDSDVRGQFDRGKLLQYQILPP
jgi:hypothetical protein